MSASSSPKLRVHCFAISLSAGLDMPKLGYRCSSHLATPNATHVVLTR
jgi:hypothetical protein